MLRAMPNPLNPVTLQTLALKAGLSVSGVSLALRGSSKISAETQERVRRIADEIGYRPNAMVSALMAHIKGGRPAAGVSASAVIGWLNNTREEGFWRSHPYTRPFLSGASQRAEQLGFRLEEFWIRQPGMASQRLQRILQTRSIEGVVITQSIRAYSHVSLDLNLFAAATFQHGIVRPSMHRTSANYFANTLTALRELRKLGYNKIGMFLTKVQDRFTDFGMTSAFLQWQRTMPDGLCSPLECVEAKSEEVGSMLTKWLKRHKPDAVLCVDNRVPDIVRANIPGGTDKIGVAHIGLASEELKDGISGIDIRAEQIAAATVDSVVAQLHRNERGMNSSPKLILIDGIWIPGATTPGKMRQAACGSGKPRPVR